MKGILYIVGLFLLPSLSDACLCNGITAGRYNISDFLLFFPFNFWKSRSILGKFYQFIQITFDIKDMYIRLIDMKVYSYGHNETTVSPVYEAQWVLFKMVWCYVKAKPCPWPLEGSKPMLRTFKWGTVWHFTSRASNLPILIKISQKGCFY